MSLKYHGVIVPEGTDLADAPKAFRDLTDFGNAVGVFATLTERDAWASPPDGALCVVLKSSGVPTNLVQQYTVGVGWRSYDPNPVGVVQMYTGSTAPSADWLLCNGQAVPAGSEYDALRTLVGASVPDLRDRFVLGAGPKAVGVTGGAFTATLTTAQMPAHSHTGLTGLGGTHAHGALTGLAGAHSHTTNPESVSNLDISARYAGNTPNSWFFGIGAQPTSTDGNHNHAITSDGNHNHAITAEGGGQSHSITPPYYVLSYIIRAR